MNQQHSTTACDDKEEAPMTWRRIGAVASLWAERLSAQRDSATPEETESLVPLAWAAE